MSQHQQIMAIVDRLRKAERHLFGYEAMGYCGYFSYKLHKELEKVGIDHKLLHFTKLRDTKEADKLLEVVRNTISRIPLNEKQACYRDAATYFKLHPHRLKKNIGHIVVLVGSTCYDCTSEQFGWPQFYSIEHPEKVFSSVAIATIELGTTDKKFGIKKMTVVHTSYDKLKERKIASEWLAIPVAV